MAELHRLCVQQHLLPAGSRYRLLLMFLLLSKSDWLHPRRKLLRLTNCWIRSSNCLSRPFLLLIRLMLRHGYRLKPGFVSWHLFPLWHRLCCDAAIIINFIHRFDIVACVCTAQSINNCDGFVGSYISSIVCCRRTYGYSIRTDYSY